MTAKTSQIPAAPFEVGSFALAPGFPAVRLDSEAAFGEFVEQEQDRLEARRRYEDAQGTKAASITREGTCAPCLRATVFTSATDGGERLKDGSVAPLWREAMRCDCTDALNNRERALLHFVQAAGILPWTKMLLLGPMGKVATRLAGMATGAVTAPGADMLPATGSFHIVVSADHLQFAPAFDPLLAALCDKLLDGGRLIFTVPFQPDKAATARDHQTPQTNKSGWDLLDRLRQAGFRDAAAYLYWSEELGYLGPANFIFRAVR